MSLVTPPVTFPARGEGPPMIARRHNPKAKTQAGHCIFNPHKLIHRHIPQTPRKGRNCHVITARYARPDGRFARAAQMSHVRILILSDSGGVLKGQDPALALVLLAFENLLKDRRDPFETLQKLPNQVSQVSLSTGNCQTKCPVTARAKDRSDPGQRQQSLCRSRRARSADMPLIRASPDRPAAMSQRRCCPYR